MRVYRIHVIRIGTAGHIIYIVGLHISEDVSGCMTPPHSCPPMRVHRIRVIRIGTVGHMIYIVGLHTSVVRRVQCCKLCYSTPYDMSMVVGHSSLLSVNLAFDC